MKKKIITFIGLLALTTNSYAWMNANVQANSNTTTTGVKFGATGRYDIEFRNDSFQTMEYTYSAWLCPERNKCESKERKIRLVPNDTFKESISLGTIVFYNRSGVYKNKASIVLQDSASVRIEKSNEGTFMVYQGKTE